MKTRHMLLASSMSLMVLLLPWIEEPKTGMLAWVFVFCTAALIIWPFLLRAGVAVEGVYREHQLGLKRAAMGRGAPPAAPQQAQPEGLKLVRMKGDDTAILAGGRARLEDPYGVFGDATPDVLRRIVRVPGDWIATSSALWFTAPDLDVAVEAQWKDVASVFIGADDWPGRRQVFATLRDGRKLCLRVDPEHAPRLRTIVQSRVRPVSRRVASG